MFLKISVNRLAREQKKIKVEIILNIAQKLINFNGFRYSKGKYSTSATWTTCRSIGNGTFIRKRIARTGTKVIFLSHPLIFLNSIYFHSYIYIGNMRTLSMNTLVQILSRPGTSTFVGLNSLISRVALNPA